MKKLHFIPYLVISLYSIPFASQCDREKEPPSSSPQQKSRVQPSNPPSVSNTAREDKPVNQRLSKLESPPKAPHSQPTSPQSKSSTGVTVRTTQRNHQSGMDQKGTLHPPNNDPQSKGITSIKPSSPKRQQPKKGTETSSTSTKKTISSTPTKASPATVSVPRTDHVYTVIPNPLQELLNQDRRMRPWMAQVIRVIDGCYTDLRQTDSNAAGVIELMVTMHKNARPEADIKSLPSQLGGIVACATTKLLRTRMPLFTGPEAQRFKVKIHFTR